MKIIDRKKDIVKLQNGEYVSLNKIESVIKLLPLVENCCVIADGRKSYCVCLIQPNLKYIQENIFKTTLNENNTNIEPPKKRRPSVDNAFELVSLLESEPNLTNKLNKDILDHCLKHGLARMEIPLKNKLVEDSWLPITGLVTDSLKIKRKEIEKFYAKEIQILYA